MRSFRPGPLPGVSSSDEGSFNAPGRFRELAWKRRWPDAAWAGCAIGLPVTTGISGGLPRFLLVVYPVYFALAEGSRGSPRARLAFWIASGALLLWTSGRFVNWMWIA